MTARSIELLAEKMVPKVEGRLVIQAPLVPRKGSGERLVIPLDHRFDADEIEEKQEEARALIRDTLTAIAEYKPESYNHPDEYYTHHIPFPDESE